ncbi:hypothetical protein L198_02594 [Cryptococcus wingfieldii CBS 7118]|uniref:Uncharacterized protein n=1 Tax=Cryptococcus wingfieldii CBS 7118 TaxID=1295528 RepID=A0A1E3JMI4_9TREE|nr:hypothetical protein L198_02594 [Cryptococcus wingfieldii CBS 7118]ODO01866.1 hypothetical protein L198_02594 [Cryptococcus wingfieldii CBS 7118]
MSWPTPTISSIFETASYLASRLTPTPTLTSSSSSRHAQSHDKPTIDLSTPQSERKTNRLYMLEELTDREPWTEYALPTTNHNSAAKSKGEEAGRQETTWREYTLNPLLVSYIPPLTNDYISISSIPALLREAECECGCGEGMVRDDSEAGEYMAGRRGYERGGGMFRRVGHSRGQTETRAGRKREEEGWEEQKVVGGSDGWEGKRTKSAGTGSSTSMSAGRNVLSLEFGQATRQSSAQGQQPQASAAGFDIDTTGTSRLPETDLALSDHAEDFLQGLPAGTTATKRAALNWLASQSSSNFSDKSRPLVTPTDNTSKRVHFASTSPPHAIHPPNDPDPDPESDDYAWGDMSAEAQRFLTTGRFRGER